ncbi:MAG: phosphotransferase [Coriobacteriales bacterium]|nr:phosphotransferase [Coriobacteriales bacterium]
MKATVTDGGLTIFLEGSVTAASAPAFEAELTSLRAENPSGSLTLDASDFAYISSAGLRVLMKLARKEKGLSVIEASPTVYDIFEITGFTQILDVRKALRQISVEGCECIGRGGNGAVYRLDEETIVKIYYSNRHTLDSILNSRAVSQKLMALGIPVAIAFDVVRVGDEGDLGLVFELLNCKTIGQVIHDDPSTIHMWAKRAADILKQLHTTEQPEGTFPDARDTSHAWVNETGKWLSQEEKDVLNKLYDGLPYKNTLVHGDFHTGNMMVQDDEIVLIDVDDLAQGEPILDFASMFTTFENITTEERSLFTMNMTLEETQAFYKDMLECYYGPLDEQTAQRLEFQRKLYGMPKLLWGLATTTSVPDEVKAQYIPKAKAGALQLAAAVGIK